MRYVLILSFILLLVCPAAAQDALPDDCADVRYLIDNQAVPYAPETTGGGNLRPGTPTESTFAAGQFADFWAFSLSQRSTFTLTFQAVSDTLEFNLFNGMAQIPTDNGIEGYQPTIGGQTQTYTLLPGAYTLVIQRQHIAAQEDVSYQFQTDLAPQPEESTVVQPGRELTNVSGGASLVTDFADGKEILTFSEDQTLWGHAGAILQMGRPPNSIMLLFENSGQRLYVGDWATQISLLGGNLAASGETEEGVKRTFYLESFYYRKDHRADNLDLGRFQYPDGTDIEIDWQDIQGAWLLDTCAGIRLQDGRSFVAPLAGESRTARFTGGAESFTIDVGAPQANLNAAPIRYQIAMDWAVVAPETEVTLEQGVFSANLRGARTFSLQASAFNLLPDPDLYTPPEDALPPPDEAIPVLVTLLDRDPPESTLRIDWDNISHFALVANPMGLPEARFAFLDGVREGITARPADGLARLEARENVVHMVYAGGAERLLLPAEESFLELYTPGGAPPFETNALPDQYGYMPRALNNTGGECYPVNTLLAEANCPPNGHPNPANGSLWYAVTDHTAPVGLALARSYNSGTHHLEGPFGAGWNTIYRIDYPIDFDSDQNARVVDLTRPPYSYPMGLDLTWAPRGLVTYTTPSGSRHPFIRDEARDPANGEAWQALTMPGWWLYRDHIRAPWRLVQDEGIVYHFDRAGRLKRFTHGGREFTIDYPWQTNLNGPDGTVTITDAAELRRLELYYDTDHHIVRSILRDVTQAEDTCSPEQNCFETAYTYDGNRLIEVIYPDGQRARYRYDGGGRLTEHDDPRAPIAPNMEYTYADTGRMASAHILTAEAPIPWRTLEASIGGTNTLNITVTDMYGNARVHTYRVLDNARLEEPAWRSGKDNFTLTASTHPLDGLGATGYTWTGGLLTRLVPPAIGQTVVRNAINFGYTPDGQLTHIDPEGYIGFMAAEYDDALNPVSLSFSGSAPLTFTYDDDGQLQTVTNADGATYIYERSGPSRLTVTRANDGRVWEYVYNALGLVESVTQSVAPPEDEEAESETEAAPYTTTYTWDPIGRLIEVNAPALGVYRMDYTTLPCQESPCDSGAPRQTITVTDPAGAVTRHHFDGRGRPIETHLSDDSGFLRKTTYEYKDPLGRLTAEVRWLAAPGQAEGDAQPARTTYTYTPTAALSPIPGSATGADTVINGYQVAATDPYGRTRAFTYDALERIRQTEDSFGHITRYDYEDDTAWRPGNAGYRIVQRDIHAGETVVATTNSYFDRRWRLLRVQRLYGTEGPEAANWEILQVPTSATFDYLEALGVGVSNVHWLEYDTTGRAAQVELNHRDPISGGRSGTFPVPNIAQSYDFLGRPVEIRQDAAAGARTLNHPIAYCPLPAGARRVIYGHPQSEIDCTSADFEHALDYGPHGRLVRYEDAEGVRTFAYTADPDTQGWRVDVRTDGGDTAPAWTLHYNAAGDLVRWVDDAGIGRTYQNDTLGRLRAVEVANQPEASFTFDYNQADLLTHVIDGLGRGAEYFYNAQGQLILQKDANTGAATTYNYDSAGLMTSVTTPLGNTTSYLYEDPHDPTRLTHIVTPTGIVHEYRWEDATNSLTYTDPRGQEVTYAFDSTGVLWQILDPLGRAYQMRYDALGNLRAWLLPGVQRFNLDYDPVNYATIVTEQNQPGWQWRFEASADGRLTGLANPLGQVLDFFYDPLRRLAAVQANDSPVWSLSRAKGEPALEVALPDAPPVSLRFDALYRLRAQDDVSYTYRFGEAPNVTLDLGVPKLGTYLYTYSPGSENTPVPSVVLRAEGRRATHTYNTEGLLTAIDTEVCMTPVEPAAGEAPDACLDDEEMPVWRTNVRFEYDTQGRPIRVLDAEQNVETFAYDDAGNLITYQNADGMTFTYLYDKANRLLRITAPTGVKLLLAYNDLDRVTGVCRTRAEAPDSYEQCAAANGEMEQYSYDSLGRLVEQRFPNAGAAGADEMAALRYGYDAQGAGLLTSWGADTNVMLAYTGDGLMLSDNVSTGPAQYTFFYNDFAQLASIESDLGTTEFVYDQGQVAAVATENHTVTYSYQASGWHYEVENAGAHLQFGLDSRGFLTTMDYKAGDTGDDTPLVTFDYSLWSRDERVLVIQIAWNGEDQTTLRLNRRGEPQRVSYRMPFMVLEYESPGPQTTFQRIAGDLLRGEYHVVTSYDKAGRPLSMRVHDAQQNELVYTLSFTYDSFGKRLTEQRQYQDGTQLFITYQYDALYQMQLTQQQVEIILPAEGQPERSIYILTYVYDGAGNLRQIDASAAGSNAPPEVCAEYVYDSANRLIGAIVDQGRTQRAYAYDAYNRLARADESRFIYQGTSNIPSLIATDETVYRGQVVAGPLLFLAGPSGVAWALHDGGDGVLAAFEEDGAETGDPMWLSDPLGRYFTASAALAEGEISPCQTISAPDLALLTAIQPTFDGMVWDGLTNLYFTDGRVYAPGTGRFLQRDPHGPDALGNVYDYPSRQVTPPVRTWEPSYRKGLHILNDALETAAATQNLTAESTAANPLYGHPEPAADAAVPFFEKLAAPPTQVRDRMVDYLHLPGWLQAAYNYPGARLDASGALRLAADSAPGQGGWGEAAAAPEAALWDFTALDLPQVGALLSAGAPPVQPFTAYRPHAWRPALPSLASAHVSPPALVEAHTPSAVGAYLPQTLSAPAASVDTLDVVQWIESLPARTGMDWLEARIAEALPAPPALPLMDSAEWRDYWFNDDALGIYTMLDARWPVPPAPESPVYLLGPNALWEHLRPLFR